LVIGDSIARMLDEIINKGHDMTVCLPGIKIEDVMEIVGQVMGNGHEDPYLWTCLQIMLRRQYDEHH